jgi:hypothetical protein
MARQGGGSAASSPAVAMAVGRGGRGGRGGRVQVGMAKGANKATAKKDLRRIIDLCAQGCHDDPDLFVSLLKFKRHIKKGFLLLSLFSI